MTGKDLQKLKKLDRRTFIEACAGVALLGTAGAAAKFSVSEDLVRPPGAVEEKLFQSLCIKCNRCLAACPTEVIRMSRLSEGAASLRTPVLDFRRGCCEFCNRCIDVCPTGALKPYEGESIPVGKAEITQHCIALRTGGCTKCFEACEYDAIHLDAQKRPIIDESRCNGCGKCVRACPAHVFQSFSEGSNLGVVIRPTDR